MIPAIKVTLMADTKRERPLSHYAKLAESGRQETNSLSDTRREASVKKAFALIYGETRGKTVNTGRR